MADADFFEAARTCDLTWKSEPGECLAESTVAASLAPKICCTGMHHLGLLLGKGIAAAGTLAFTLVL